MKQKNKNKNKNCVNSNYKTMVYMNTIKLLTHWSSKVPKRYKHNVIFDDLYRKKKIYADLDADVTCIIDKFWKADYALRFIIIL